MKNNLMIKYLYYNNKIKNKNSLKNHLMIIKVKV